MPKPASRTGSPLARLLSPTMSVKTVRKVSASLVWMFIFTAMPWGEGYVPTENEMEKFRKMQEEHKNERKKILQDALKLFEEKNINARTILKEGHPSHTIVETARDEGFDMIIIGSRGLSGFKKVFLGSVSGAVVQEAKDCIVTVVK